MSKQIANSKANAERRTYVTYNFEKTVSEPNIGVTAEGKEIYATTMANRAGFYFEACFYQAFCAKAKQEYDPSLLNTNQKQAVYNFNGAKFDVNTPKKVISDFYRLKAAVENAAKIAADLQYRQMEKRLQELTKKNHTYKVNGKIKIPEIMIENIAVSEEGGGNIMGDMKVVVAGEEHILELKWQSSSNRATRYFGPVSDQTLFNGGFAAWVRDRKEKYWTLTLEGEYWSNQIAFEALPLFLNDRFGSSGVLLNYLLAKGNLQDAYNVSFNKNFSTKAVVHANFTGVTIQGLPELAEQLRMATQGIKIGTKLKEALIFFANGGEEVATFGLSSFRNRYNIKNEKTPTSDAFSFQFYIAQKYVGMIK